AEAEACRQWAGDSRIEVIPNGLPAAEFDQSGSSGAALERWPELEKRRVMLYVGRLWSGKGLDILPEAWALSGGNSDDWTLVIAGPGYRGYEEKLRARIEQQG